MSGREDEATGLLRMAGRPLALCLSVAVSMVPATATAQLPVVPPAGTFVMRAELEGVHPRLYFVTADIPTLRAEGLAGRRWFLDRAESSFGSYVGRPGVYSADWHDYLYGFWGQFYMDMAFLVREEQRYADTAKDWALYFARNQGVWLADDLVPMEITSGVALTYDILYDQFTEGERAELRAAIYAAADYIYDRFFVGQYWTGDYQNNHMHNRIHGMAHAAFAIYGDDPALDVQPHADLAVASFRAVADWLPDDGSTHEGPGYWSYGRHWVVRTGALLEHVTGSDPLTAGPGFGADPYYRIYLTTPGWRSTLGIGDSGDGPPDNFDVTARVFGARGDGHGMAVLRRVMQVAPETSYQHTAWGLLWYDAALASQPIEELPLGRFWPDLEMLSVRSGWDDDATALVFKCGPPGGHRMQQRAQPEWFNVAHDHPDQNHFLLYAFGKHLAEDDGYPTEQKLTRSHNTLLFDGAGGPREETGWYQPFPYEQTARTLNVFLTRSTAFATGDATPLYAAVNPTVARVVRHLFFVEGSYLLLADELAGNDGANHDFEWRLHKDGVWSTGAPGQFFVAEDDVRLDLRFLAPAPATLTGTFLPAELTAPPCLAVTTRAPSARLVSLLVPQRNQLPLWSAETLAATNATAVRATEGTTVDCAAVAETVGPLSAGELAATAAAALVRMQADALALALLVRGTALSWAGVELLASDQSINAAWRPTAQGGMLEVEAPYRAAGGNVTVSVGGLLAGHGYEVSIPGTAASSVTASAGGAATLALDLSVRRTVTLADVGLVGADGTGEDGAAGGDGAPSASNPRGGLRGGCGCAAGPGVGALALLAAVSAQRLRKRRFHHGGRGP